MKSPTLQIIIPTYNRAKHVDNMLRTLLAENAPTQNLPILVLDNNSTDDTAAVVRAWQEKFKNVAYHKNRYNLGLGGNIARALELADHDYAWFLGDDDVVHFDAWPDLEKAIAHEKEIIVAANYAVPHGKEKDLAYLMGQLTFISACIFKTSLLTDTTMSNIINNIYTLFPHLVPVVEYINAGKQDQIYLLPRALASNGMKPETDISYIRGYDDKTLYLKQRSMSWICGYANVLIHLNDKKLLYRMMENPIENGIFKGWLHFVACLRLMYPAQGNWLPFWEVVRALPWRGRILCVLYALSPIYFTRTKGGIYLNFLGLVKLKIRSVKNK